MFKVLFFLYNSVQIVSYGPLYGPFYLAVWEYWQDTIGIFVLLQTASFHSSGAVQPTEKENQREVAKY